MLNKSKMYDAANVKYWKKGMYMCVKTIDFEEFQGLPVLSGKGDKTAQIIDYGTQNYLLEIEGSTLEDYWSYLAMITELGYNKYVDNGPKGLREEVWSAIYTKDDVTITILHVAQRRRSYITFGKNIPLSEHLHYKEAYVADNRKEAKTTLHMLELHTFGDSFVIQLKNGHFILDDSGMTVDGLYLLDYLESLTSQGEKPIVEAWFISHGHGDHLGTFIEFGAHPEYAERICVEGIYFNEPSIEVSEKAQAIGEVQRGKRGFVNCRTSNGCITPVYRPKTGQRYYFSDITIDVLHTQEQLPFEKYRNGFNDSSTWLLYTIDGQTFLHGGDAGKGSIEVVKETYGQEYLDFDVMTTFHHGQNIYDNFVDYFNYRTVLYTTFVVGSQTAEWKTEENMRMQERAKECMSWGDGTKILTFPYVVGSAQSLPMKKWIYNPDRKTPVPYSLNQ